MVDLDQVPPAGVETLRVTAPGEVSTQATVIRSAGKAQARVDDTAEPGIYQIHQPDPTGGSAFATVAADPRESDLRPLEPDLAAALARELPLTFESDPDRLTGRLFAGGPQSRHEIWRYLILATLAGLCMEIWLTRRMAKSSGIADLRDRRRRGWIRNDRFREEPRLMTFQPGSRLHLVLAGSGHALLWIAAGAVALALLLVLSRYELRLVSRRAAMTLLGTRLAAMLVLVAALFEPIAERRHEEKIRGRVILGVDLSESMATADPVAAAEDSRSSPSEPAPTVARREIARRLLNGEWFQKIAADHDVESVGFARDAAREHAGDAGESS